MLEKTVHVTLAIHDRGGTYSKHSGVVMESIFERTKSPVCVHILHDETLTGRNRSMLAETAESFGQRAEFYDVSRSASKMGNDAIVMAEKKLSAGSLYRLMIPDVLAVSKVIYLDSDIIVNMDIRELWDIPLDGRAIAGALDRGRLKPYRRFSATALKFAIIGCDRLTYINAGVLLMNLARIRDNYNLIAQSAEWFDKYGHIADNIDQDMLNSCFRGDIKVIESKFNNLHNHDGDISGAILHAIGFPKPWNGPKCEALDKLYWKTFLRTPWGRLTPEETADLMFDAFKNSPMTHRRTGQCYRAVLSRLNKDVIRNGTVKILSVLCKELRHRLTRSRRRSDA